MIDKFSTDFASDNAAQVHSAVFEAMVKANQGSALAYGSDSVTEAMNELFKTTFTENIVARLVCTGTGANSVALATMALPHQAILCAKSAHINEDECGAPESLSGAKLIGLETIQGKITPAAVQPYIAHIGDRHRAQPRVISISQTTECGTVYSFEEVRALVELAHSAGMLIHMDGARLCNAAVSLRASLFSVSGALGIDALSFGLTKNGAMQAESVIFFDTSLVSNLDYILKRGGQLFSKARFDAAQFIALLDSRLWWENASHANAMAELLYRSIKDTEGISFPYPVQANELFARLPVEAITELQENFAFYQWDDPELVRWVASFATSKEEVLRLASLIKAAVAKHYRRS